MPVDANCQPIDTEQFRAEIAEKMRSIAVREEQADQKDRADVPNRDVRVSVRKVLENFQQEVIRQNIWIRIYDDHGDALPTLDPQICRVVEETMKSALRRHQRGKVLAYVEISFLINESGTVITIEDNAPSLPIEEVTQLPYLHRQSTNTLSGGYTVQAVINDPEGRIVGDVSVRCVANCFTRFTLCVPH